MPTCDPVILTPAAGVIRRLNPKSVLDIGVGLGKWGLLTREYTDVWHHQRFYQKEWQTVLHGIEVHEEYKNPVWDVYNRVYRGNALDIIHQLYHYYDLTIMIDVLEHFKKQDGFDLIHRILLRSKHLLISYSNCEQKDVRDNPYEDHISKWSSDDFPPSSERLAYGQKGDWGLFLLSQ